MRTSFYKKPSFFCAVVAVMLSTGSILQANAQHAVFSLSVEQSIAGVHYGSSLCYENSKKWKAGVFYQTIVNDATETELSYQLPGVLVSVPLSAGERLVFSGNIRSGLVNKNFLVVIPGLETEIILGERLSVSVQTSIRLRKPSAGLSVNFKI